MIEGCDVEMELVEDKQLAEFLKSERFVHFVGMMMPPRPGIAKWVFLSQLRYCARQENDLFAVRIIEWRGTIWAMVSIPVEYGDIMEEVAQECGLRVVKGAPLLIEGKEIFPMLPVENDRIFTLV